MDAGQSFTKSDDIFALIAFHMQRDLMEAAVDSVWTITVHGSADQLNPITYMIQLDSLLGVKSWIITGKR